MELAKPGDMEALSTWLWAQLRAGAVNLPRSGHRAPFAIRVRKAPDRVKRREVKQRTRRDQRGLGPGKPEFDESTVIKETLVMSLLCHSWATSVRQSSQATSPYWAIFTGYVREDGRWRGTPGHLYLAPVLERGAYRFAAWHSDHDSIPFVTPEALLEYLGPQWGGRWDGQQRLVDWVFPDVNAADVPPGIAE